MMDISSLRSYEAVSLRPYWDLISGEAAGNASTMNWESAPASAWNPVSALTYVNRVVPWGMQVSPALHLEYPEGTTMGSDGVSLGRQYDFHVSKVIHLQKLGLSVPVVPNILQATLQGFEMAARNVGNFMENPLGVSWGAIAAGAAALLGVLLLRGRG